MSKRKRTILIGLILLLCVIVLPLYFVLFTSKGGEFVIRQALKHYALEENIEVKRVNGTIYQGIHFEDVGIAGLKQLPGDLRVNIQDLSVRFSALNLEGLRVEVVNGQIKFPVSDPVVIQARVVGKRIQANVIGKGLQVEEVITYLPVDRRKMIPSLKGRLTNVDVKLAGPYKRPDISGSASVDNLKIAGLPQLPGEIRVDIQDMDWTLPSLKPEGMIVQIDNGRVKLPVSDPLVIQAKINGRRIEANVFSSGLDVEEVMTYLPVDKREIPALQGRLTNVDIDVTGQYDRPDISGSVFVDEIKHSKATLAQAPVQIDLEMIDQLEQMRPRGDVKLESGSVKASKTQIELKPSRVIFHGEKDDPDLQINGQSRISQVDISIEVRGAVADPKISLNSEPSLPKEQLLLMLATGQKWPGLDKSINNGSISPELAKDFVRYFAFGGSGNTLAQRVGLDDLNVIVGENRRGVGARKEIGDKLEVKYQIERETDALLGEQTTQTVGGAYRVTNRISLDIQKEFRQSDNLNPDAEETERSEIMLKYKRSF